jgi:hypothetical protein
MTGNLAAKQQGALLVGLKAGRPIEGSHTAGQPLSDPGTVYIQYNGKCRKFGSFEEVPCPKTMKDTQ